MLNCTLKILVGSLFCLLLIVHTLYAKTPPFKNFGQPRLVEPDELANRINHPLVRVVDMRSSLIDYLRGHIPNAFYLHFESIRVQRNGIPAQSPDRMVIEKILGEYLSLSNEMWVILYSEKSNPNATFLAWTLDLLGHQRVGILNGGWEKWILEKHPMTQEYPFSPPKKFFGKYIREALADKKYVLDRLQTKGTLILDARPPKQYSGEEGEEIRKGHIPGAKNLFWETTLEGEEIRVWKKKEALERLLSELGISKDKEIIVHCRTGREASHLYFTLKHVLGFPHVRLYRGSWVEWSADRTLPVKIGMDP